MLEGQSEVVSTTFNPAGNILSGGMQWFSNTTGQENDQYQVYRQGGSSNPDGTFGKALGVGDIEAICTPDLASVPVDFGDAFDSYHTTSGNSGPSHILVDGFFLGSCVDNDNNGQPAASNGDDAIGDDTTAGSATIYGTCTADDDEDGVDFSPSGGASVSACQSTSLNISFVHSATSITGACLDAWIDFDADGTFDSPRDRIATCLDLITSPTVVNYTVPCDAAPGTTYARFRLSQDGVAGPRGSALNGEVEDYTFEITSLLAVELSAFTATLEGVEAKLYWETSSETNNAGFVIEHAMDNESFTERAFVEGAGTTNEVQHYQYRLADLAPGMHRFRLKQVDFDGTSTYSPVLSETVEVPHDHYISPVYPNPFSDKATFKVMVATSQPVKVDLYTTMGQHLEQVFDDVMLADQLYTLQVQAGNWASGVYLLQLSSKNFVRHRLVTFSK